jgi:hypothetical protein
MGEEKRRLSLVQIAGLLFFLIILPAGSWYYLQSGFNHRKEALAELKELGKVNGIDLTDQFGMRFTTADMRKCVTIAGFLPADAASQDKWAQRLSTLHEQFDDRDDICFLLLADSANMPDPAAFLERNALADSLQLILLLTGSEGLAALASNSFYLPAGEAGQPNFQYLALADTAQMVRRHYDLLDNQQMGRLVEHITIVMPKLPEPDIVLKRERER